MKRTAIVLGLLGLLASPILAVQVVFDVLAVPPEEVGRSQAVDVRL
jgi:hypothetical protein